MRLVEDGQIECFAFAQGLFDYGTGVIGTEDDLRQGAIGVQKLPYSRWLGGYLKRALIAPSPWIILRPIQIGADTDFFEILVSVSAPVPQDLA